MEIQRKTLTSNVPALRKNKQGTNTMKRKNNKIFDRRQIVWYIGAFILYMVGLAKNPDGALFGGVAVLIIFLARDIYK